MEVTYLLVTGIYETYTVLGVYTDRSSADIAAAAINAVDRRDPWTRPDARVEGIPLNPALADIMAEALWLVDDQYEELMKDYERRKRAAGIED